LFLDDNETFLGHGALLGSPNYKSVLVVTLHDLRVRKLTSH
jgi:hypothetical protein